MLNLDDFEKKVYSQNGEDGITMLLLELLYNDSNTTNNKYYVEFGVENGCECNTRILREFYKWNGLQMDGSFENGTINLKKEFITKDNVCSLFNKYNVPKHINLLSVDIDFNDFYCMYSILKEYTMDIIICEYNGTFNYDEDKVIIYNENQIWDGSNYFGASLLAYTKLMNKFGYDLVYCNKNGVNAFFVNRKLILEKNIKYIIENLGNIQKLYKPSNYNTGPNNGHPEDKLKRRFISSDDIVQ